MKKHLVAAFLGASAAAGPLQAEEVRTNAKLFRVEDSGVLVVIEGTWRATTAAPSVEVPRTNSVRAECHRTSRKCVEHIAKLIRPSEDSSGFVKEPTLLLMKEEFVVVEWSEDVIVARAKPRAADVELRISLKNRTAERTSRETSARGATGADPAALHVWRLE